MSKEEFASALKGMSNNQLKAVIIHMSKADIKEAVKNMTKEQLKEALKAMSKEQLKEAFKSMTKEQLQEALKDMSTEQLAEALKTMTKEQLEEALKGLSKEQLREALKNMTEAEIRALRKAGKLDGIEGIDDIISPYVDSDDSSSTSDGEGGRKKKKKKKRSDSAYSYYSFTSEGGTRYVRRKRRRPDGTYSDSESCPSDVERRRAGSGRSKKSKKSIAGKSKKGKKDGESEDGKTAGGKAKKKGGKGGKDGESEEGGAGGKAGKKGKKGKGGADGGGDGDSDSDYSVRSEVSAGGTRRQVKMKRIRDEDGNVVGYGDPVPYDYRAESVAGRRGSMESLSQRETTLDRENRRQAMEQLEAQVMKDKEREAAEEKKKKYQEEREKLNLERKKKRESLRGSLQGKDLLSGKQGSGDDNTSKDGVLLVQGQGADQDENEAIRQALGKDDVPSDFSDDSLDDENVDLSKMTEEEKQAYFEQKEKRRQQQEARRRAKYGDKYDEIIKKKQAKKEEEARKAAEEEEQERQDELLKLGADDKRRKSFQKTGLNLKNKEKPKSMVTYDKGPPRWPQDRERSDLSRDPGPGHDRRNSRSLATSDSQRRASRNDDLETGKYPKLPPIKGKVGGLGSEDGEHRNRGRRMHPRGEMIDKNLARTTAEKQKKEGNDQDELYPDDELIELDESGRLRLRKGKKVDLSKLSDDMLRKLGIDPNLSNKEKAKLLKKLFGSDIEIMDKGNVVGTKGIDEYDLDEVTDDMLAADPNLDIDTLKGQRRVNILMRRGGMLLKEHMKKVMEQSRLTDETSYRNDLDEKGGIDFMHHYRLVEPGRLEAYARAFVVEDGDLDTVINLKEMITALDGVPTIQHMTEKQFDYVFKVLNIHDATQVTFRMFAVITALCERVTSMDNLSKHLLEICNLADIERKLDLYRSMFYHNIQSGLDPNFITSDSLKIELIAGGLSWLQQQYITEKMETNIAGNISFLDYMCYIPLFMSMHDNIVDNPLDMSDQKYTLPPRTRPASAQRDLNPLGFPLSKNSSLQMRHKAKELQEGRLNAKDLAPDQVEKLHKFAKLPEIKPMRRTSTSTTKTSMSSVDKIDLIF